MARSRYEPLVGLGYTLDVLGAGCPFLHAQICVICKYKITLASQWVWNNYYKDEMVAGSLLKYR